MPNTRPDTGTTLDDNFVAHHAGLLATWCQRVADAENDLTGPQRAALAELRRVIDLALGE